MKSNLMYSPTLISTISLCSANGFSMTQLRTMLAPMGLLKVHRCHDNSIEAWDTFAP